MGISMLAFFSLLNLEAGLFTLILAHITFSIAYVIVVVRARLDGFDIAWKKKGIRILVLLLGKTLTKITLPVISPGIIAGGLLAFTLSLDDVIISFLLLDQIVIRFPLRYFQWLSLELLRNKCIINSDDGVYLKYGNYC